MFPPRRPKIELHQRVRATKNEERTKKPKPEFGEEKAFNHRNTGWPTIPRVACSSGHTYTHRRRHFFSPIPLTVTQSQLVGRRLAKTNAERVKKQPLYSIKDSIMDARFLFRWSIPHSGTRFFLLRRRPLRENVVKNVPQNRFYRYY